MEIAKWLETGSRAKAESIVHLAPTDVRTVVEIGCGTGAVLGALDRMAFAEQYWACEPEADLHAQIPAGAIQRLVSTSPTTFDVAFPGQTFDLAILTHVVEHLITPAVLVAEAIRRSRYVIVEVPLDNSPAGRARAWVRGLLGHERLDNSAGHVQFLSRRTARELVAFAGGTVVADRSYFPREATKALPASLYRRLVLMLARSERLGRAYHEHYAMLVVPTQLGDWKHHYHRPE